jgi:hypothetical protein
MNLIPTLISLGLAASVSFFYLQNQSDEPNKINYRAALSDFEQTALEFAAHTPLQDISVAMPPSHCANLSYDFEGRLPAGSESNIDISGLNCDMATLSITTADEKDFQSLLNAAGASGRSYATEANTSATPPTKTLKWTQRLYSRNTFDLGVKAKLKNNYTGNCISCTSSTKAVAGKWSHEPNESWNGCPAPGVLTCGVTGTRRCSQPLNFGKECQKDQTDNSFTSLGNRTETHDCFGVPKCGQWVKQANCPTNTCVQSSNGRKTESICRGNPCKLDGATLVAVGTTKTCNTPRCGAWEKEDKCATMHCLNIGENDPEKPKCVGEVNDGCINDQGILVRAGTTEMCQLPACTELTINVACPSECKAGDGYSYEEYTCNGARCKNATSKLWKNEKGRRQCPPRPCSKLTDWAWDPPGSEKKTCLNKDDTQPKKTRTCEKYKAQPYDNFGCRDTKGVYVTPGKHTEETVPLPGCPYWGSWGPWGQCMSMYNQDDNFFYGEEKQQRECFRYKSNGIDKEELPLEDCFSLDKVKHERSRTCDYEWGEWDRTEKSCPRCVETTNNSDYGTCDGGENQKSCILGTTIFESGIVAKCSHAVPKCGKWREWSACEFEDNDGYGSCTKMDGTKTRVCSSKECEPHDFYWTFTKAGKLYQESVCHTPKCEVKIDTSSSDNVINKNKGTIIIHEGEKRDVRLIIKETAVLTSTKIENCAFTIKSHLKSMTLINRGVITGYSGKGGAGGEFNPDLLFSESFDDANLNGHNGQNGGDALCITKSLRNLTIRNYGVIKGGRAGGGGGGAACYKKTLFGKIDDYGCLKGGDGGDGSNFYLQSIVDGKPNQQTDIDSYGLKSGSGGNGGYLFPDSGSFKLDQAKARSGVNAVYDNNDTSSDIEVFKGDGGKPGNEGRICKLNRSYSRIECPSLIN